MAKKKRQLVEIIPPGSKYSELLPGSIYRILRETAPESDRNVTWIKAPPKQRGKDGDFFIRNGVLSGQYTGNRPGDDDIVEFIGVLRFDVEEKEGS